MDVPSRDEGGVSSYLQHCQVSTPCSGGRDHLSSPDPSSASTVSRTLARFSALVSADGWPSGLTRKARLPVRRTARSRVTSRMSAIATSAPSYTNGPGI